MLVEAAKQGRIFMVNYLLESNRVDINERDKDGQTPLINACLLADKMAATRRKLTRLFLSRNADVNLADNSGRNALMWACHLAKIDVVKILFGRSLMDLDFTCVDQDGNTALHYVSAAGNYTLTSMLVEAMKRFDVSLDRRNNDGMTPLLAATKNAKEMCAKVLLQNGASPDIVDPQSLMNVKELAESGNLVSLVEQITIRNPRTQSRCAFPRKPDDDDMRSAMHVNGRKSSTSPTAHAKSPVNQSQAKELVAKREKKTQTPLLGKRKEKETKLESGKSTPREILGNLLEMETRNPFLTQPADFSEVPSPSASECNSVPPLRRETKSAYPRIDSKSVDNPYNLRDLKQVLSLYGEQQLATFRKGFATPVMSTEEFQECLEAMKPKPLFSYCRMSSHARRCSSTSSIGLSPLLQHRRRSVLLKEYNMRDPSQSHRRQSISRDRSSTGSPIQERPKDKPFVRNLSDPLLDLRQPEKTSNLRRHSLMVSIQPRHESVKNR